jgi:type IVB pilus formation R64 PilN family outer membrane protein
MKKSARARRFVFTGRAFRRIHAGLAAAAALCAGGCVSPERMNSALDHARQTQTSGEARHQSFRQSLSDRRAHNNAQDVAKPWLAGRARPLAREVTLPAALRKNVDTTLMFAGGEADLAALAQQIARATGIPVRIRPDAMLPPQLFLPRLSGAAAAAPALPTRAELPHGPQPLPRVLDALAWRLGVYWRYTDGAIDFYRTETRVFDVRALTLAARADVKLGRSGKTGAEGFENTSNTTLSTGEQDTLAAVRARIEPFLTRAGTLAAVAGAGGSVVITDTRDALDQVGRFIDRENKALTRRVRLVFEEVTVVAKDGQTAAIDWNAIYSAAGAAVSLALPAPADVTAGVAGLGVHSGPFRSSRALISALSEVATVVRHSTVPVLTLNRRPVTHAVRTTFSYIDQVQSTSISASGAGGAGTALPAVSISQKHETVGSFLTLVPDAQEDGQILLSVAYDNTVAQPLKSLSFGKAGNQLEIQQVTIDGNGTVQQVELRAGQPMVISGFDRRQDEYDRRRPVQGVPLLAGGTDHAATQRATTVVIVTAQVEEGF